LREARDEIMVRKVIESCTTLEQCKVARNLIQCYETFYTTCGYALDRMIQVREDMILYQKGTINET